MAWGSQPFPKSEFFIACPECRRPALFRQVAVFSIVPQERRALFAKDSRFRVIDTDTGPIGLFWRDLSGDPASIRWLTDDEVGRLTNGFAWGEYAQEGSCLCDACGYRRPHRARWPEDAYYQIEHKGHALWAADRSAAVVLADFVAAPDRAPMLQSGWGDMLKRVPTHFLTAQNRGAVEKKLRRLLEDRP